MRGAHADRTRSTRSRTASTSPRCRRDCVRPARRLDARRRRDRRRRGGRCGDAPQRGAPLPPLSRGVLAGASRGTDFRVEVTPRILARHVEGWRSRMSERASNEDVVRLYASGPPRTTSTASANSVTPRRAIWPQSGERVLGSCLVGGDRPATTPAGLPHISLDRLVGSEDRWVVPRQANTVAHVAGSGDPWWGEWKMTYPDGQGLRARQTLIELREGLIWRETVYWAEPFEAPDGGGRTSIAPASRAPDVTATIAATRSGRARRPSTRSCASPMVRRRSSPPEASGTDRRRTGRRRRPRRAATS